MDGQSTGGNKMHSAARAYNAMADVPFDSGPSEGRTLNSRIVDVCMHMQAIGDELDRFLERVTPRPPAAHPTRLSTGVKTGQPPLSSSVSNLEEAAQRLHSLIQELSRIA